MILRQVAITVSCSYFKRSIHASLKWKLSCWVMSYRMNINLQEHAIRWKSNLQSAYQRQVLMILEKEIIRVRENMNHWKGIENIEAIRLAMIDKLNAWLFHRVEFFLLFFYEHRVELRLGMCWLFICLYIVYLII